MVTITSREAAALVNVHPRNWSNWSRSRNLRPVGEDKRTPGAGRKTHLWDRAAVLAAAPLVCRPHVRGVPRTRAAGAAAREPVAAGAAGLYGLLDAADVAELNRRRAKRAG